MKKENKHKQTFINGINDRLIHLSALRVELIFHIVERELIKAKLHEAELSKIGKQ